MEVHIIPDIKYHIILTQDEAEYIKGICQNDLTDCESDKHRQIRRTIFDGLQEAGVK